MDLRGRCRRVSRCVCPRRLRRGPPLRAVPWGTWTPEPWAACLPPTRRTSSNRRAPLSHRLVYLQRPCRSVLNTCRGLHMSSTARSNTPRQALRSRCCAGLKCGVWSQAEQDILHRNSLDAARRNSFSADVDAQRQDAHYPYAGMHIFWLLVGERPLGASSLVTGIPLSAHLCPSATLSCKHLALEAAQFLIEAPTSILIMWWFSEKCSLSYLWPWCT